MRYLINDVPYLSDQEGFHDALAALAPPRRVFCMCKHPAVEMSVHLLRGAYHLWCMPNSAGKHATDCSHYEPPLSISGKGQVMGSAIDESQDGEVTLRLDFALTKIAGRAPPAPKAGTPETAESDPTKLTMRGLLHYLWQEAGFHKWSPKMVNKRTDWVFHKYAMLAAANKRTRAGYLGDILVIPKPGMMHGRGETAEEANTSLKLARAATDASGTRRLALVLGDVQEFEEGALANRVRLVHMPDQSLELQDDLFSKVKKAFGAQLSMWEPGKNRLIMLASFYTSVVGAPVVNELVLMNVTKDLMPYESLFEQHLLRVLTDTGRRFTKSLRFNLKAKAPMASAVLTDTEQPCALFIQNPGADPDAYQACVDEAQAQGLWTWLWRAGVEPEPALPAPLPLRAWGDVHG
jgi:hypothetical protein